MGDDAAAVEPAGVTFADGGVAEDGFTGVTLLAAVLGAGGTGATVEFTGTGAGLAAGAEAGACGAGVTTVVFCVFAAGIAGAGVAVVSGALVVAFCVFATAAAGLMFCAGVVGGAAAVTLTGEAPVKAPAKLATCAPVI